MCQFIKRLFTISLSHPQKIPPVFIPAGFYSNTVNGFSAYQSSPQQRILICDIEYSFNITDHSLAFFRKFLLYTHHQHNQNHEHLEGELRVWPYKYILAFSQPLHETENILSRFPNTITV